MPTEAIVAWPAIQQHQGMPVEQPVEWEPMTVRLYSVQDPWGQPLYAPVFAADVPEHRRPRQGVVVVHPVSGEELALIVRVDPDPPYERLIFRCTWLKDGRQARGFNENNDYLVESRRWIAMRPDGMVIRATATKDEAIRLALMNRRVRHIPPVETQPVGRDLDALAGLG